MSVHSAWVSAGYDECSLVSHRVYDSLRDPALLLTNQGNLDCENGTFSMLYKHT